MTSTTCSNWHTCMSRQRLCPPSKELVLHRNQTPMILSQFRGHCSSVTSPPLWVLMEPLSLSNTSTNVYTHAHTSKDVCAGDCTHAGWKGSLSKYLLSIIWQYSALFWSHTHVFHMLVHEWKVLQVESELAPFWKKAHIFSHNMEATSILILHTFSKC